MFEPKYYSLIFFTRQSKNTTFICHAATYASIHTAHVHAEIVTMHTFPMLMKP